MTGGVGKVAGAILGAVIMMTIDNGMSLMNLDAYWQFIVKGVILVLAVLFDTKSQGNKGCPILINHHQNGTVAVRQPRF